MASVTIENVPAFIREYMDRMWAMLGLSPLPDVPDTLLCVALQKYLLPHKDRIDKRDRSLLNELQGEALFADFNAYYDMPPYIEEKVWRYLELFCTLLDK